MCVVYAIDGTFLVFVRFAPRYGFRPIKMWSDRIAIAIYLYLIGFVATILWIGQTFAYD